METTSAGKQRRDAKRRGRAERVQEQRKAEVAGKVRSADDTYHLKVFRYNPEVPEKREPRFSDFHAPYKQGMTILDTLMWARDHYDSSLTFWHSCRQATYGSDALFINRSQRLDCKTQLPSLSGSIQIEPLPHPDVVKDLAVDMEHFYNQTESIKPCFQTNSPPDSELDEQRQTREDREKVRMSARCIWHGACMSSCDIAAGDNGYLGPATISEAYRFAMDEREDEDMKQRHLEILEQEYGVRRC